jgi:hypothetical protein
MAALRGSGALSRLQSKSEAIGMADVIFLALGGGAFGLFAALAAALKRV